MWKINAASDKHQFLNTVFKSSFKSRQKDMELML